VGHAAEVFEREAQLGRLLWKLGGVQAYEWQDGDSWRLTTVDGGYDVVHGIDGAALR
jgi:hypothetical protein